MALHWLVLVVTAIAMAVVSELSQRADTSAWQGDVSAISHNLLVYRQAMAAYAQANPAVNGNVADSALTLPTWFVHLPGVEGYVVAGSSYTFYPQPPAGLARKLVDQTQGSVSVGLNTQGRLVSPGADVTLIVLPAAVPEGAAVLYQ